MTISPLSFEPILKRIRWGGTRLGTVLGKQLGGETDYAESWEIADHGSDQSIVISGDMSATDLGSIVRNSNSQLFGCHAGLKQFPLLIKFLDANDWLSLQVHPNDEQARTYDSAENGKTEAWVILDAEPGSQICVGLRDGVTKEQFTAHLEAGTVEETLNMFEVQAGDCIFVPAGTVHAIGAGVLLAEVQQQSDLTFRLHDWGRLGSDGQPREIHIEQSLACIDFDRGAVGPVTPRVLHADDQHTHEELVREDYFVIQRHVGSGPFEICGDNAFRILMLLQGNATVKSGDGHSPLTCGSTLLVPAEVPTVTVIPDGPITLLEVFLP
ncbi:MAG: type I phosphomannose isomerase catalytic subunit [Planctomycetaceae bacterium]